jgi:GMP synthase-like glutamine amidotransferase
MKPVAIFRHSAAEGPGYFAEYLDQRQIPWQLIAIDAGAAVPQSAEAYSGLAFMGGPMSVNDDLPWIKPVLALIRDAVTLDIPVLGHCLGGQLISKALGAVVTRNAVKEIGWAKVVVAEGASVWFGQLRDFQAFHWHGETFSLPKGATPLLSSAYCANQAYAIGPHLALQCHVEMTAEMIAQWCAIGADEVAVSSASVQSVTEMQRQDNLPGLHEVAKLLYTKWISGLTG